VPTSNLELMLEHELR